MSFPSLPEGILSAHKERAVSWSQHPNKEGVLNGMVPPVCTPPALSRLSSPSSFFSSPFSFLLSSSSLHPLLCLSACRPPTPFLSRPLLSSLSLSLPFPPTLVLFSLSLPPAHSSPSLSLSSPPPSPGSFPPSPFLSRLSPILSCLIWLFPFLSSLLPVIFRPLLSSPLLLQSFAILSRPSPFLSHPLQASFILSLLLPLNPVLSLPPALLPSSPSLFFLPPAPFLSSPVIFLAFSLPSPTRLLPLPLFSFLSRPSLPLQSTVIFTRSRPLLPFSLSAPFPSSPVSLPLSLLPSSPVYCHLHPAFSLPLPPFSLPLSPFSLPLQSTVIFTRPSPFLSRPFSLPLPFSLSPVYCHLHPAFSLPLPPSLARPISYVRGR
ncbi:hypothetical protein C7M84_001702 [Penaeus vannamei]|uniref:UDENN domain-containing protein n=1 Tax=Penaeus vannamei TaxID=6689 RepID=A0A3R7PWU5_PENVA|nr:hypothetical protein C7M84_001702 [Penaeus vannamei]